MSPLLIVVFFFFFNDTATTEIYPLPLHDALPISANPFCRRASSMPLVDDSLGQKIPPASRSLSRSEEHTSELQSPCNLVCRLLLEKKKNPTLALQLGLASSAHARPASPSTHAAAR